MARRRAKLTVLSRRLLVHRILVEGMVVTNAADMVGSAGRRPRTGCAGTRPKGAAGLEDRSSRPVRSPRALPQARVEAILGARHEHRSEPDCLASMVGVPRSTIGDVLTRHGLPRPCYQNGPSGIRYVRERDARRVQANPSQQPHLRMRESSQRSRPLNLEPDKAASTGREESSSGVAADIA
jgi:hypothetical protein